MSKDFKNLQYYKFSAYGFLRNLRFFDSFLLLFLLEKGMNYSQIGLLYAVKEIALNVFEIPSGIIADTFGRKKSLAFSFLAFICSFLVFYLSYSFILFVLAFTIFGIADSFRTGTHKGMIMDYLKLNGWSNYKTAYYAHTRSWSQIGLALSALIAGAVVLYAGSYQSIFIYSIIPYALNLLLLISYPAILDQTPSHGTTSTISQKVVQATREFVQSIRRPVVFKLMASSAIHTAFQKSVKDYIQPAMVLAISTIPAILDLDEKQKNGLYIGLIYFVIYLFTSKASRLAAMVVSSKVKKWAYRLLIVGFAAGVFSGMLYDLTMGWLSLIAFSFVFLAENMRKPIMTGLVADAVPVNVLTSVLSAQSQLRTILSVVISIAVGVSADLFGVGIALAVVSGVLIFSSVFLKLIRSR